MNKYRYGCSFVDFSSDRLDGGEIMAYSYEHAFAMMKEDCETYNMKYTNLPSIITFEITHVNNSKVATRTKTFVFKVS